MIPSKQSSGLDLMKPREIQSFEAAIAEILESVGHAYAAEEMGLSESMLRKWSDPDEPKLPNLSQALRLDSLYRSLFPGAPENAPLAQRWLFALRAENLPARDAGAPAIEVLGVTSTVGRIAEALREALADGSLNATEREMLRTAIKDARTSIDDLAAAIDRAS